LQISITHGLNSLRVYTASKGQEAIEAFSKDPKGFDLVLLDLHLPGMDGAEVMQKLYTFNPQVKAFFTSGNLNDLNPGTAEKLEVQEIVEKPFSLASLLQKIKNAFHEEESMPH